jgi:hypothetical protein
MQSYLTLTYVVRIVTTLHQKMRQVLVGLCCSYLQTDARFYTSESGGTVGGGGGVGATALRTLRAASCWGCVLKLAPWPDLTWPRDVTTRKPETEKHSLHSFGPPLRYIIYICKGLLSLLQEWRVAQPHFDSTNCTGCLQWNALTLSYSQEVRNRDMA